MSLASDPHIAYIGIGSNKGDRMGNCRRALELLNSEHGMQVGRVSRWHDTEALSETGPSGQERFINAVAEVATELSPEELLAALIGIERLLGRPHPRPTGLPRAIDLDILLYDGLVLDSPALTIPHPKLSKRLFVLTPLCDIAPTLVHPVLGFSMRELENKCSACSQ